MVGEGREVGGGRAALCIVGASISEVGALLPVGGGREELLPFPKVGHLQLN